MTRIQALGEEGRVLNIDADGDVKVNVGGAFWTFNPEALSLVEQGTGSEGIFEQDIRAGTNSNVKCKSGNTSGLWSERIGLP